MGAKNSKKRLMGLVIMLSILIFSQVLILTNMNKSSGEVTYHNPSKVLLSDLKGELSSGNVDTVYIDLSKSQVRYTLLNDTTRDMTLEERNEVDDVEKEWYYTDYPYYEDFPKDCMEAGAQVVKRSWDSSMNIGTWLSLFGTVINIFFIIFMIRLFSKTMGNLNGGGGFSAALGVGGDNLSEPSDITVTFEDVIGHDEVIEDIKLSLKVMQAAEDYKELDVRPPRGILLAGPPGTGKTMIAKACAKECGLKFFEVNSSSLIDKFVGQGASAVRSVFKKARENQPCILFFDEIDAIGGRRDESAGSHSEDKKTIDAMLQELDGFRTSDQVYVMAATNIIETLDPALVRAGRFDKKIYIGAPRNATTRVALLRSYLKTCNLSDDVNLTVIAKQLSGMSGADIANIANEAKLIAVQNDDKILHGRYFEEAIDKTLFSGNRTKNEYKKDTELVAYHESGHALSSLINHEPIARISIIPNTSGVGGMVVHMDKETMFTTKSDYENRLKTLYAGRIAEELIFGTECVTTGASNDLQVATQAIDEYINKFAFDTDYSLLYRDKNKSVGGFQSGYDRDNYSRMNALAIEFYDKSKKELSDNLYILKVLAKVLLAEETLDSDRVVEVYEEAKKVMEDGVELDEYLEILEGEYAQEKILANIAESADKLANANN